MDNQFTFLDIITILSFVIAIENYNLNNVQVSNLDNHLRKQDDGQLQKIIEQNEEILKRLEGVEKCIENLSIT